MVSTNKIKFCLLICTYWAHQSSAVPMRPPQIEQHQLQQNNDNNNVQMISGLESSRGMKESPRILASMFGSVIESIPFLPLNLNVPDALTGMYSLVTQYFGSSEPKSSGKSKKKKKKKKTTTTTTTTTTPKPESSEEEDEEEEYGAEEADQGEEPDEGEDSDEGEPFEEEESKRLTILGNHNGFGANFEDMLEDYIKKKNAAERKRKHKRKKRGKHKHNDMLHKIASHLAYLELEC